MVFYAHIGLPHIIISRFQVLKSFPDLDRAAIVDLIRYSWERPQREFQYFSYNITEKYLDTLIGSDDETFRKAVDEIKWILVHEKSYWDTVDWIAPGGQ